MPGGIFTNELLFLFITAVEVKQENREVKDPIPLNIM